MTIPATARSATPAAYLGAPVQGADLDPIGNADPVPLPTRAPFVFVHYPDDYEAIEVDGRTQIVPLLTRLALSPGANHVDTEQRGQARGAQYRAAFADVLQRGGIILHADSVMVTNPDHLPAGVTPGRYLRALSVRDRVTRIEGMHWHEVWEVWRVQRDGTARATYDRQAYARWRLSLIAADILPAALPDVVARFEADAEAKLARIESDAMTPPDVRKARTAEARAALEKLQADLAGEPEAPAAPVPPAVPQRRTKADPGGAA